MTSPTHTTTRFAPSPTGMLHVGGLRTALYAYLISRQTNGTCILRIEDTDAQRTVSGALEDIVSSLTWAGLTFDEGIVGVDDNGVPQEYGDNGPYVQSQRRDIYKHYVNILIEKGAAYPCFCTPERLQEVRAQRMQEKLPPGYDKRCRNLSEKEQEALHAKNTPFVVRLAMPDDGVTVFNDEVRGDVSFPNKDVDDQVLLKTDGNPTYHLANVVDDHTMNVNLVIRGEEWISSTPKHIQLYKAFEWESPRFAHLPLLLNTDKSKLSKRQGDVSVSEYRKKGYLPEALINFVAFLGWNPGTEEEIFSLASLIENFSLDKVHKGGAVFNIDRLRFLNRHYMKELSDQDFLKGIEPFTKSLTSLPQYSGNRLSRVLPVIRERIDVFSDVEDMYTQGDLTYYFEKPDISDPEMLTWKQETRADASKHLLHIISLLKEHEDWSRPETLKDVVFPYAEQEGKGSVLWPLRVSLSGKERSPDPFTLLFVLGKEESIERIEKAHTLCT